MADNEEHMKFSMFGLNAACAERAPYDLSGGQVVPISGQANQVD